MPHRRMRQPRAFSVVVEVIVMSDHMNDTQQAAATRVQERT